MAATIYKDTVKVKAVFLGF
ncbi:hypothetical protein CCACVL1_23776 [Corchorus capsularis]|uniref:Uncharacterized protein n=1 Tax=Corchorus capsularis TaxID=210143 RepID=A0A1R3GSD5_COCAP|nr:hypothetical protein CCACVL1_23776 [Corchorus capsularis]